MIYGRDEHTLGTEGVQMRLIEDRVLCKHIYDMAMGLMSMSPSPVLTMSMHVRPRRPPAGRCARGRLSARRSGTVAKVHRLGKR